MVLREGWLGSQKRSLEVEQEAQLMERLFSDKLARKRIRFSRKLSLHVAYRELAIKLCPQCRYVLINTLRLELQREHLILRQLMPAINENLCGICTQFFERTIEKVATNS